MEDREQILRLQRRLLEGKVFKRGATWKKLEKFFGKSQETIIEELSRVTSQTELSCVLDQITANQHYLDNVRILDPACLESKDNVSTFFALNSKLYSISGAEDTEAGKELMSLNYLVMFSPQDKPFSDMEYDAESALTEKEKSLFRAYYYFKNRGKKVLLLTPEEDIIRRAASLGIDAATFGNMKK